MPRARIIVVGACTALFCACTGEVGKETLEAHAEINEDKTTRAEPPCSKPWVVVEGLTAEYECRRAGLNRGAGRGVLEDDTFGRGARGRTRTGMELPPRDFHTRYSFRC